MFGTGDAAGVGARAVAVVIEGSLASGAVAISTRRARTLRLCDAGALTAIRRSLEQHGQLCALSLFVEPGGQRSSTGSSVTRDRRVIDVEVQRGADVRLCEAARDHRLVAEHLEHRWLVGEVGMDPLDRDGTSVRVSMPK